LFRLGNPELPTYPQILERNKRRFGAPESPGNSGIAGLLSYRNQPVAIESQWRADPFGRGTFV
jgi:hypothetical protein